VKEQKYCGKRQLGFSGLRGKISECCDNWVVGLDLSGGLGWPVVYLLCFFYILFPSKTAAYFSLSTLDAATS